jgi:hypothetical protein
MRTLIVGVALACGLALGTVPAAAQTTATCQGAYVDGSCYVGSGGGDSGSTYWPTNNETAYNYGVYAVAPGYGPYLRLGGESGWDPNIGTTYNSYPPGDYYSDYGFPTLVSPLPRPLVVRTYYGVPYAAYPYCAPAFVPWR